LKILLTGGTGFVGRHLLRELLQRGNHVACVVRPNSAKIILPDSAVHLIETDDLFSESVGWWERQLQDIELVVHAAWFVEPGEYLQSPKNLSCLQGTLTLARACIASRTRKFVSIGTCFEYDLADGALSVETPLNPKTLYAASKASTFLLLTEIAKVYDLEFLWCRLFYLFGEGEDERKLVRSIRKSLSEGTLVSLGSGKHIRDFIDVTAAADKIVDAALSSTVGPINICSGVPQTVKEIAINIATEYGRVDLLRFGSREDNTFDPPMVVGIDPYAASKSDSFD